MNRIRKVNVGCGPHHSRAGWLNIDIRAFPGVDRVMDATLPWKLARLDYVYAEHFLEHLPMEGALAFLSHAGSSLRRGGTLRLSTPNLEWVLLTHFQSAREDGPARITDTLAINRAFHGWGHHFIWSEPMLTWVLEDLGFEDVSYHDYGESPDPELAGIEAHGEFFYWGSAPSVLIVEARRGKAKIKIRGDLEARLEEDFLRHVRDGH